MNGNGIVKVSYNEAVKLNYVLFFIPEAYGCDPGTGFG